MQSGTSFHIALLRKTSNARRKKLFKPPKQNQSLKCPFGEDNFQLSGWNTEEDELKHELKFNKKSVSNCPKNHPGFMQNRQNRRTIRTSDPSSNRRHNYSVNQMKKRNTFKQYRELQKTQIISPEPYIFTDCTNTDNNAASNLRKNAIKPTQAIIFSRNQSLQSKLSEPTSKEKQIKFNKLNIYYSGKGYPSQNQTVIYLKKANNHINTQEVKANRNPSASKVKSKESFSNFIAFHGKNNQRKFSRL